MRPHVAGLGRALYWKRRRRFTVRHCKNRHRSASGMTRITSTTDSWTDEWKCGSCGRRVTGHEIAFRRFMYDGKMLPR